MKNMYGQSKCKAILSDLMTSVKECQTIYGKSKTLLATEKDIRIQHLCINWELVLSHGLKTTSVFKNICSGNITTEVNSPTFWDYAFQHLTAHEKERFSCLRYVYTDLGKVRALLRAALNERALERYISTWLSDAKGLEIRFESWALLRDSEASNLLPSIAAGLSSILFAITVDSPDLNVLPIVESKKPIQTNEIIVAVPKVSNEQNKLTKERKRNQSVIQFEDDNDESESPTSSYDASTSLSDTCLKYEEKKKQMTLNCKLLLNYENEQSEKMSNEHLTNDSPPTINKSTDLVNGSFPTPTSDQSFEFSETFSNISNNSDSICSTSSTGATNSSRKSITFDTMNHNQNNNNNLTNSLINQENIDIDKQNQKDDNEYTKQINELKRRCTSLEEQVKTLTLENSRLKSLHHNLVANRQTSKYFSISIPRVILQRTMDAKGKKYFAYEIQIIFLNQRTNDEKRWTILRRYSDFHRLHKYLQKDNVAIKLLDFPPKKSFGNMNANFVEQRRQRLQVYLLSVLSLLPEIQKCMTQTQLEQAFPFFRITHQM